MPNILLTALIVGLILIKNKGVGFNPDIIVSLTAEENGDGTLENPVISLNDALTLAKQKIENEEIVDTCVIALREGNYSSVIVENFAFDIPVKIVAYNNEKVTISQNVKLDWTKFKNMTETASQRVADANNVYQLELSEYGIDNDDIGKMYAVGKYQSEPNYLDKNLVKIRQCELYIEDKLQSLARYPNDSELAIGDIIRDGKLVSGQASPGGIFKIDGITANRLNNYATLNDVWLYGYFGNDWADNSTTIKTFDYENKTIETNYAHNYSYKKDKKYHIYNVLEELDNDGEYYIDRTNNVLYIYSTKSLSGKQMELSVGNDVLLTMTNCKNITIEGLEFSGTKKDGIKLNNCENLTMKNNTMKEITGTAMILTKGRNNVIDGNDIFSIDNAGISCKFDTPSIISYQNNVIKNNKIHTFGQITRTYSPAVSISGMGNYVQNNTIYDSPHTAIQYNGNYNIIEKNEIYNVCRFSGDCGAIYSGRSFSYYGNVIRYNYLHDIGEGAFKPNGIYLDDYLSGQEVCYNVIANVRGAGILGGGGRDNKIYNNVFLNATMSYDERARVSYNNGNVDYTDTENGNFWKLVKSAKSLYTKWNVQLTSVFDITNDVAILDTANFGVNPANNVIKDNLFASGNGNHYSIRSYVQKFSTVENNIKTTIESVGFDKKQSYDLTYVNELVKGICQNNQLKEFQVAC